MVRKLFQGVYTAYELLFILPIAVHFEQQPQAVYTEATALPYLSISIKA